MNKNFSRSGGFRKSATSSMPNRCSAPSQQMPNTTLLSSALTVNSGENVSTSMGNRFSAPSQQRPNTALPSSAPTVNRGENVSTSMGNRFSAPSQQMPNTALLSSAPTMNSGENVSTSMSDLSVANKPTEVKCVDWPEYVGQAAPRRGEQFVLTRDMKGTFNNAKLLKQIVDQDAKNANLPVGELPRSLIRPQSQAAHQPTHQPPVINPSAVEGGFHAVLSDTSVRSDTAWPLGQKLSSDIATGATASAKTQSNVGFSSSGFKKPRDSVTNTPELSSLEQMKNAGLKPGVNPNKVFYEGSDSSNSPTSTETPQPRRADTMGSELAKMRRLQEIMQTIQQNPILEDIVKNTMATIKKFASLNDEDSKLLDTCFAYRY